MKYCIITFLFPLFFVLPGSKTLQAQDLATALAAIQQAEQSFPQTTSALDGVGASRVGTLDRYFKKAVSNTLSQLRWKKLKWFGKRLLGNGHTVWCITYADGFQAYNDFRSYRTPEDVAAYYLGQGGGGSWYYRGDRKIKGALSYRSPENALMMLRNHGQIVDVSFYRSGRWIRMENTSLYNARSSSGSKSSRDRFDDYPDCSRCR